MYKALFDFAWCINFDKVLFSKDEIFGMEKAKCKEVIEEMLGHQYIEPVSEEQNGENDEVKSLQDMTKVELIEFAQKNFNVSLSGNKNEIISQIEELAEKEAIESENE